MLDKFFAYAFLVSLCVTFVVVPVFIAYYLYRRKFMSDRLRYAFAGVLCFNVLFIAFLVILDLLAQA